VAATLRWSHASQKTLLCCGALSNVNVPNASRARVLLKNVRHVTVFTVVVGEQRSCLYSKHRFIALPARVSTAACPQFEMLKSIKTCAAVLGVIHAQCRTRTSRVTVTIKRLMATQKTFCSATRITGTHREEKQAQNVAGAAELLTNWPPVTTASSFRIQPSEEVRAKQSALLCQSQLPGA
jgi:hypothetical protein